MVAEFTSDLNFLRDCNIYENKWWSGSEEDEAEALAQEVAGEEDDNSACVQDSLVEMFHEAAADFHSAFEIDDERGLGSMRPLTLRLNEQVEGQALRQVKLRVWETLPQTEILFLFTDTTVFHLKLNRG